MNESVFGRRKRIADLRLAICRSCEYFREDIARCRACGCIMTFKALLPDVDCPFRKWDEINKQEAEKEKTNGIDRTN
jgi:hypothetical protein